MYCTMYYYVLCTNILCTNVLMCSVLYCTVLVLIFLFYYMSVIVYVFIQCIQFSILRLLDSQQWSKNTEIVMSIHPSVSVNSHRQSKTFTFSQSHGTWHGMAMGHGMEWQNGMATATLTDCYYLISVPGTVKDTNQWAKQSCKLRVPCASGRTVCLCVSGKSQH